MRRPRPVMTVGPMLACLALAACGPARGPDAGTSDAVDARTATSGNPEHGRTAITAFGCGACHTIPGVRDAVGEAGPPLTKFAHRTYVAGEVANTSDNLVRWIRNPQAIEPNTAMPNLGVSEQDARNMAAYLYTLR